LEFQCPSRLSFLYVPGAVELQASLSSLRADRFEAQSLAPDAESPLFVELVSNCLKRCRIVRFGKWLTSQIIVEEGKGDLITSLVLLEDNRVVQVCASGHPAVDLVGEGLDVLRYLEVGLVFLDILCWLIL
jgi:hypothetical protein